MERGNRKEMGWISYFEEAKKGDKLCLLAIDEMVDILGEGIARKVFALNKNLVVKVAKGEDGLHQNFVESYIFKNAPYNLKRYLCPVLLYNKRILICLELRFSQT